MLCSSSLHSWSWGFLEAPIALPDGGGFYYSLLHLSIQVWFLHHRRKKTSILCQIGWFTKGEIGLYVPLSFFHKRNLSPKITALILANSFRKYSRLNLGAAPLAGISYPDSLSSDALVWSWQSQTSMRGSNPVPLRVLHHTQPWQEPLWHPGSTGEWLGCGAPLPLTYPQAELYKKRKAFTTSIDKDSKASLGFFLRCIHDLYFFLPATIWDLEQNTLKKQTLV